MSNYMDKRLNVNISLTEFIKQNKIKDKCDFLPVELFQEINKLVEKNYSNDWNKYLDDVSLYFDTFTPTDLNIADFNDSSIKFQEVANEVLTKRQINALKRKKLHHASCLLKLVGKDARSYVSRKIAALKSDNILSQRNFIENNSIISKEGKIVKLKDVSQTGEQAIAEKLNICDTMQRLAVVKGWTWSFITVTLDREFHPNPTRGKMSYNGVSPAESAKMLKSKWNNVRAMLKERGITPGNFYHGVCASEAHKDGCIHLHFQIFHSLEIMNILKECFIFHFPNLEEDYQEFVNDDNDEIKLKAGAWKTEDFSKPDFKTGDTYKKGEFRAKASSYVLKYVMKSLGNFDSKDNSDLGTFYNSAFRSAIGVRGVSFFGIEQCMTKFRFLARNKEVIPSGIIGLTECIETNDLFEFINKFAYLVENIYMKIEDTVEERFNGIDKLGNEKFKKVTKTTSKFMGVKINSVNYLKRFFKLARTKDIKNNLDTFTDLANEIEYNYKMRFNSFIFGNNLLVNHNSSSENQKPAWIEINIGDIAKRAIKNQINETFAVEPKVKQTEIEAIF